MGKTLVKLCYHPYPAYDKNGNILVNVSPHPRLTCSCGQCYSCQVCGQGYTKVPCDCDGVLKED